MTHHKRIGILTSGGDCAGLNAVLRAVTLRATYYGWDVLGIHHGTLGLLRRPLKYQRLTPKDFEGSVLRLGGTILGTTNKGDPFAFPMEDGTLKDRSAEFAEGCRLLGLDALIGVGGDGSLKIIKALTDRAGIPFTAIPKTIDNDLGLTENALGFLTAVDVATQALDRLQPTAASHDRVMILEVMGRDAGHIALSAGIAGGADVILIPEIPYQLNNVAGHIRSLIAGGRNFALIVVAESVKMEDGQTVTIADVDGRVRYGGIGHYLAHEIMALTGAETRFTVLGHVQRGGEPSASDRVLAAAFGIHAVDLIHKNLTGRMVAWRNRRVIDVDIDDAIGASGQVPVDDPLVLTARGLGISFGDGVS